MKILMVCLGNICRSPLAEGILQHKLGETHQVDSCGTSAYHRGEAPDARSIQVAQNNGVDISNQQSRPINQNDLNDFDVIYVMDEKNYHDVIALATDESQQQKVKLILQENSNSDLLEVPDPYYGKMSDFEYVYQLLEEATDVIADRILKS